MKNHCKWPPRARLGLCADRVVPLRVGDAAKNAHHTNPKNTVFDARRLIGRRFEESDVKKDMKHWPLTRLAVPSSSLSTRATRGPSYVPLQISVAYTFLTSVL